MSLVAWSGTRLSKEGGTLVVIPKEESSVVSSVPPLSSRPGRFQTDIKSGWATREGTCRSHPSFLSSLVWDVTCGSIAVGSDEKGTVDSGFDPTARQGMFFNIFPAFLLQDL